MFLTYYFLFLKQNSTGFGLGVQPDQVFDLSAVSSIGDADGLTDKGLFGDQSYSHTLDLSEVAECELIHATLEIMTGGQGFLGLTTIIVDGVIVGELTDGEIFTPDISNVPLNTARLDILDLFPVLSTLDSIQSVIVDTEQDGDYYVIDYSEMKMTYLCPPCSIDDRDRKLLDILYCCHVTILLF